MNRGTARSAVPFIVFGHILQVIDDGEMLRAYAFTLSAADAFTCFAAVLCDDPVVREIDGPAFFLKMLQHVLIVDGKELWNGDVHGTSVSAVGARGTGNGDLTVDDLSGAETEQSLFFIQRPEVLHEAQVVLHLLHTAHAGEDHHDIGKGCRKADGPGRHRHLSVRMIFCCFLSDLFPVRSVFCRTCFLSDLVQDEFFNDFGDAVVVVGVCDIVRSGLEGRLCVFHGDTETRVRDHGGVVHTVAAGDELFTAADVNGDGQLNAKDASDILRYYAYLSTGGTLGFKDFLLAGKDT